MKLFAHHISWTDSRTDRAYELHFTNHSPERCETQACHDRIEAENFDPVFAVKIEEEIEPAEGEME